MEQSDELRDRVERLGTQRPSEDQSFSYELKWRAHESQEEFCDLTNFSSVCCHDEDSPQEKV